VDAWGLDVGVGPASDSGLTLGQRKAVSNATVSQQWSVSKGAKQRS